MIAESGSESEWIWLCLWESEKLDSLSCHSYISDHSMSINQAMLDTIVRIKNVQKCYRFLGTSDYTWVTRWFENPFFLLNEKARTLLLRLKLGWIDREVIFSSCCVVNDITHCEQWSLASHAYIMNISHGNSDSWVIQWLQFANVRLILNELSQSGPIRIILTITRILMIRFQITLSLRPWIKGLRSQIVFNLGLHALRIMYGLCIVDLSLFLSSLNLSSYMVLRLCSQRLTSLLCNRRHAHKFILNLYKLWL